MNFINLLISLMILVMSITTSANDNLKDISALIGEAKYQQAKVLLGNTDKSSAIVRYYLGRVALYEQQLEAAEQHFESILDNGELAQLDVADLYYWLAVTKGKLASSASWFKAAGYASDAKQYFEKALSLKPDDLLARQGLFQYYLHAPAIVGGSVKKARQQIDAVALLSAEQAVIMRLSLANYQQDKHAILSLAQTLANFRQSAKALYNAGIAFQQHKHYQQAYACFSAAELLVEQEKQTRFAQLSQYQLGKNAVLSGVELVHGKTSIQRYLSYEITDNMPEKYWAKLRLAQLHWLAGEKELAQNNLDVIQTFSQTDQPFAEEFAKFEQQMAALSKG